MEWPNDPRAMTYGHWHRFLCRYIEQRCLLIIGADRISEVGDLSKTGSLAAVLASKEVTHGSNIAPTGTAKAHPEVVTRMKL